MALSGYTNQADDTMTVHAGYGGQMVDRIGW